MKRLGFLALVVGVLLAAPVLAQTAKQVVAVHCVGSDPEVKDPKAREIMCLRELGDRASRQGNVLSLKLDDGRTRVFRSNPKACQNDDASHCEDYYLVGFHEPSGRYLVYGTYYENSDCKMVSARSGKATSFRDVPRFAPDGQTFFVTGVDGTYDNWIGVGSMKLDPPALVWEKGPNTDASWDFVRWTDNDQIVLNNSAKNETCPDGGCEAVLKRAGGGWSLVGWPPKSDPR
jgi:hypothetical protein